MSKTVEEILQKFAEDLISYDTRMYEAGAPPVRFINKYFKPAVNDLDELLLKAKLEELEPFLDKRIVMVETLYRYAEKRTAALKSTLKRKDT